MKLFSSPSKAGRFAMGLVAFVAIMTGAVAGASAAQGVLDYERFMRDIQPLLLTRQYNSPAPGTTCFSCHGSTTNAAFDAFPLYTEGRPRDNFISTAREIKLDQPDTSLLLLKPLAIGAGGVAHGLFGNDAGEQFQNTTNDTAYEAIRDWIVDASVSSVGARVTRTENYPNPFRFSTDIVYILTTAALEVKVTIYTASGQTIRSMGGTGLVGANRVTWNGRDENDEPLPTGIYFYTVKAKFDDGTAVKAGKCVYTP